MKSTENRASEIKLRLATLVDLESLPPDEVSQRQRRQSYGQAMLVLGVLTLVAGLYLPSEDALGRLIFIGAALLHSGIGAWSIDRANRR